ncbi:uncharacterized protein [Dermacentor albipictus]|uniref:uncharacterized protein isoform X2 n=1 Tax=Dermacentor albipictus TaxID=60249 RepID=UPI0038FC4CFE
MQSHGPETATVLETPLHIAEGASSYSTLQSLIPSSQLRVVKGNVPGLFLMEGQHQAWPQDPAASAIAATRTRNGAKTNADTDDTGIYYTLKHPVRRNMDVVLTCRTSGRRSPRPWRQISAAIKVRDAEMLQMCEPRGAPGATAVRGTQATEKAPSMSPRSATSPP